MFHSLVRLPGRALSSVRFRWLTVCASLATGLMLLFPVLADADTKEKVETVATSVGTEGVEIVLAILTALVASDAQTVSHRNRTLDSARPGSLTSE